MHNLNNDNHSASYGGCPKIKFGKKVEQLRAEQQLSCRDAAIKAQNSSGPDPVTQSHSRRLAATSTIGSPQPNPPRTQPIPLNQKSAMSLLKRTPQLTTQKSRNLHNQHARPYFQNNCFHDWTAQD